MRASTFVAIVALAGAAGPVAQVVADLGARQVTVEQVRSELRELRTSGDLQSLLTTMDEKGKAAVVARMVRREQQALAARAEGLEKRPEVAAEIDRAVTRILASHYAEAERQRADTSEPVLRAYYDAHRADFQAKPRVRAHHILTATRAAAEAVLAELAAGADFASLAAARSADPYTRDTGGELGWISEGVMVKPFEDALFALKPGASGVIESPRGFHVVRVEEVQPGLVRSFESVRAIVVERLQQAHLERRQQELDARFPVRLFPEALKALER